MRPTRTTFNVRSEGADSIASLMTLRWYWKRPSPIGPRKEVAHRPARSLGAQQPSSGCHHSTCAGACGKGGASPPLSQFRLQGGPGVHCACFAAVDAESLVDLGAYDRFTAWRLGVLLWRSIYSIGSAFRRWWRIMGTSVAPRRGSDLPTRQIHEEGVLRQLDPDSESENEAVTNPCEAERVGLILQGRQHALAPEGCQDKADSSSGRRHICQTLVGATLRLYAIIIVSFTCLPARVVSAVWCHVSPRRKGHGMGPLSARSILPKLPGALAQRVPRPPIGSIAITRYHQP